MKTSTEYLKEANALVEKIDVEKGIDRHKSGEAIFIDVRDSADIASTGTIKGSLQIPRGFIEFAAMMPRQCRYRVHWNDKRLFTNSTWVYRVCSR